jgi:hypothetical protein
LENEASGKVSTIDMHQQVALNAKARTMKSKVISNQRGCKKEAITKKNPTPKTPMKQRSKQPQKKNSIFMFLPSIETKKTLIPMSKCYVEMNIPTPHWLKSFEENLFSLVPTISWNKV